MNQQTQSRDLLQDETLAQKLIKKGFWLYLFSYLIAPGGYLIRLMISNSAEVSVADVGVLYSIIGLINFLNVYNDLGLTESLQYFLPKFWIQKKFNAIKTTIWLSLCIQLLSSFLIIFGLWFGADWLAEHYFQSAVAEKILKYFCLYFLGINLFQTLQSIFMAFQKTFDYQFVEFVKIWATVGFTVFCFLTGNGTIEWYSLNWILGLGVGIFIAGFLYAKKYHHTLMQGQFSRDKPMLKEYTQYALWAFIGANVANLFGQIIQQMVIYFLGAEAAGYYANFLSLFYIGNILISPIMGLIFPMVSELIEKKDQKKLGLLFSFFYTHFGLLSIIIGGFFLLLGPELGVSLFGEKFRFSGELLQVSSLFFLFSTLASFNFSVMGGIGVIKKRVRMVFYATILTLLTALICIFSFQNHGAVLTLGLSHFFLWGLSYLELRKRISFKIDWYLLSKNGLVLTFFIGSVFLIKDVLFYEHITRGVLITKTFVIGLLFIIVFSILNISLLQSFRDQLRSLETQ